MLGFDDAISAEPGAPATDQSKQHGVAKLNQKKVPNMGANKRVLMLPGDGIGPEVMGEVRRLIDWMDGRRSVTFDVTEDLVGGVAYESHGAAISDNTMDIALNSDAVLFGAVGGPQWDNVGFDAAGSGSIAFAEGYGSIRNLRPAICLMRSPKPRA